MMCATLFLEHFGTVYGITCGDEAWVSMEFFSRAEDEQFKTNADWFVPENIQLYQANALQCRSIESISDVYAFFGYKLMMEFLLWLAAQSESVQRMYIIPLHTSDLTNLFNVNDPTLGLVKTTVHMIGSGRDFTAFAFFITPALKKEIILVLESKDYLADNPAWQSQLNRVMKAGSEGTWTLEKLEKESNGFESANGEQGHVARMSSQAALYLTQGNHSPRPWYTKRILHNVPPPENTRSKQPSAKRPPPASGNAKRPPPASGKDNEFNPSSKFWKASEDKLNALENENQDLKRKLEAMQSKQRQEEKRKRQHFENITQFVFQSPCDEDPDDGKLKLRRRYNTELRRTGSDAFTLFMACLNKAGVPWKDANVDHTGCCKPYAVSLLTQPEFDYLGSGALESTKFPPSNNVYKHVEALRALVPPALDAAELVLLQSPANTNHADYNRATDLGDAKRRVAVSYNRTKSLGYSMSPVWLEDFETSVLSKHLGCVFCEFHSACASNSSRSHVQVVLPDKCLAPAPGHPLELPGHLEVVFLRRDGVHYHALWINERARTPVCELPPALRVFLGF
jgi:hypothetical protein